MLSNDTSRCGGKDCDRKETCARYRFRKHTSGHAGYVSMCESLRTPDGCDMHMELFPDEVEELKRLDAEDAKSAEESKKWSCD